MPDTRPRIHLWILPAYLLVVIVAVFAVKLVEWEADKRLAADHAAAVERAVDNCERRNDLARGLKGLVAKATAPSEAAAVGLTTLAAFGALDPATQAYLTELQAALAEQADSSTAQELIEFADGLVLEDCQALRNDLNDQGDN